MNNEVSGFRKLFLLLKLERVEVVSIYFYATLSGLVQLSLPLGIQAIIGFVLGATMVTSVYILIFFIVLGTFIVGLLRIYQMNVIEKVQQKIFVRYAFAFTKKIPFLDTKSIDKYFLPEKINSFFETLTIQKGLSKLLLDIPVASIQIFLGLLLLSFYHPFFIIFDIILVFILFILLRFTYKIGLKTSIEESNHKYSVLAWLQEISRVSKSLKFGDNNELSISNTDKRTLNYVNSRTSHYKILAFQYKTIVFFKVSITALMLIIGTYLLFNQSLNVGEFVAVEIVIISVIGSLEKLIISIENIYDVITGIIKIDALLEIPNEESGSFVHTKSSDGIKVEFKNVNFAYDDANTVFKDLNFVVQPKDLIVISGDEGSGKSTILKLISGMYNNFTGLILLNEIPIQNYAMTHVREDIGILLQQHDIFEGSLFDNITLGRKDIPLQEIIILAKTLGIDDFLSSLPNAFETNLDPLGRKLPITIVKKILILRALINKSSLLLLEEPWVGLDIKCKQKIIKYLVEIAKEKTVIITGSDPELMTACTLNIHIENGTVKINKP